jgi:hypothetical protein
MSRGSARGVAAIDGECDADDEARSRAAQPQDRGGDLISASEPADRLIRLGFRDVELALGDHVGDHRRLDGAGADGVDADAARRVFERGAPGQADDAVLGRVVGGAAGQSDEAAERRAVDDGAAPPGAHLPELVLHAVPDAAQVDRGDPVEAVGRLVGRVARRDHDAGVVEGHVEALEGVDRALDERGDLCLVGYVAGDAERLMAGGGQLVGGGVERALVDVGEHDGGAGRGEGPGGVAAHAGAGAGDKGDLATDVVGGIRCGAGRGSGHGVTMTLIDSRSSIAR